MPENVSGFYDPLINWARELRSETTRLDINIEYANSSSSKKLLEILKVLDANNAIKEFLVNWHYEFDDEDSLESGQLYEELMLKAQFRYIEYNEAA